ncbi:MAG: DUF3597 domain-containing protein [Pseudomonas sp.]
MGLFSKILNKLGMGTAEAATTDTTDTVATPTATAHEPAAAPTPVSSVDVVAQLEQKAAVNPQKLNWKTSIVDLLKLLDLDSSFAARKELAVELGCPSDLMADSSQMNMWLHKTVLNKIAENGGNLPPELLD